ncbi:MAG: hypothetical protein RLZZ129_2180 [Verrucomicrobiota bacterium]
MTPSSPTRPSAYNLNISRYISTATAEEEIDLTETHARLLAIEQRIRQATSAHNEFLQQLDLKPLPTRRDDLPS